MLTGALSPTHWEMVDRLARDGHQVALLGQGLSSQPKDTKAVYHDMSPNHPGVHQVLRAGRFDAIVFFYAYNSTETRVNETVHGSLLDALFQFRMFADENKVAQFFLVTDARVFGMHQEGTEYEAPIPDTQEGVLIKAAEDCLRFNAECEGCNIMLLRVTNLYGAASEDSLFALARQCEAESRMLVLPGREDSPCDFLHADDLAQFINLMLAEPLKGTVHLGYDERHTLGDLARHLKAALPKLNIHFTGQETRKKLLTRERAAEQTMWSPRHDWTLEIDEIIAAGGTREKRSLRSILAAPFKKAMRAKATPWIEIALLAFVANYFTHMGEVYALFRHIDFWLFFVILIGSMHGTFFGVTGGIVACVFYVLDWVQAGNEGYLLLVNVDNWLPFVVYLVGGGMFGYIHETMRMKINTLQREREQSQEETAFIETMYQQTYEDRNKLQEQVMRSRDSYGRIYNIARELDTLQPEQVFLSTLNVLEDTMQNHSVAMYSASSKSSFIRLVVQSRAIAMKLTKSLDVKTLPLLADALEKGELFMNSNLEAGYPSMAAPVMQDNEPVALVVLWDVPFEKQTLYYRNLFNVVVGLVQSSMARALMHFDNAADLYLEGTMILGDKAFREAMGVYRTMRKQKASSFLLLRVHAAEGEISIEEMDERLRKAVRTTDIIGRLDNGTYYALLPQAGIENLPQIDNRFLNAGLVKTVAALESIDV